MITTERLILRQWQPEDLEPFAKLNQDPRVMEFFESLRSREESEAAIQRWSEHIRTHGWGNWAVCLRATGKFIGFIGLYPVPSHMSFAPAIEIGWRLAFETWGQGLATEGARAVLAYGFDTLGLEEIVSFTTPQNQRSRRVMEKLGMHHDAGADFDHPRVPDGHPLKKHVFYRLTRDQWRHLVKKKYVYKPYSHTFPHLFRQEKERIEAALPQALAIEHVGSTAVVNLGGKGIIDLAIAVKKKEMESASAALQRLGYEYRPSFSTSDRWYFVGYRPDPEEGNRRYHIHLMDPANPEWHELIEFREYLRTHPEAAEEYARLKQHAADTARDDGAEYRKIKDPFFAKIKKA